MLVKVSSFSYILHIHKKHPSPPEGRGKAKLEGKESGTPPKPEALEAKGLNNLTHFPNW